MNNELETKKVYARALDPIHIGAGGYRLGRVDNTIVRDPATDLPKIPGTSIAGVVRAFYTVNLTEKDSECKEKKDDEEKRKCAEEKAKVVFGDETKKGILRFYDGQIIFFPVSSIQGTVWITTKELLEYWFGKIKDGEKIRIPDEIGDDAYAIKGIDTDRKLNHREKNTDEYLNLGWLLLEVKKPEDGKEIVLPQKIDNWVKRIVVVSDKLFSHIVNDNLEVRTSVRIDPDTGAAAERALFTYEAIPRGTVFGFEIGVDYALAKQRERDIRNINDIFNKITEAVSPYLKNLGIGGMGTRGFGRLEIVRIKEKGQQEAEANAQS